MGEIGDIQEQSEPALSIKEKCEGEEEN